LVTMNFSVLSTAVFLMSLGIQKITKNYFRRFCPHISGIELRGIRKSCFYSIPTFFK
jgi:hypothetical protein